MKKKSWIPWAAVFFLLFPALVWSAPQNGSADDTTTESAWYWFLGLDLGYSHYSPYNSSLTEAPRQGSDMGVRALIAHYSRQWVIDGGLGYQWINNSGTNSDNSVNTDKTTNVYIDLSPRYRFGHFQIGPEFEYWATTDNGLNPIVIGSNLIASGANTSAWLGLQGVYEWAGDHKYRLGVRGLTALNVTDRTVLVFQAFFEIGFDLFGSSSSSSPNVEEPVQKRYERINQDDLDRGDSRNQSGPLLMTPEATPVPATTQEAEPEIMSTPAPVEPEATPPPAPVVEPPEPVQAKSAPKVVLTLDVNDLPFGFNDANLPASNAARVRKIGEFLKENNKSWKSLVVEGHTDERGTKPYNIKLSKLRADTVRKLLVEGGASASKIKSKGYGKSHPIDHRHNEKAWAKNRRVELDFKGVKNVVLMKKAMNQ